MGQRRSSHQQASAFGPLMGPPEVCLRSGVDSPASDSASGAVANHEARIVSRFWIIPLAALLLGCGSPGQQDPQELAFPGPIVMISIDTLRADHLSSYGYDRLTSPRIDTLAGESYLFQWTFSQAPSTGPSHASIFTGLYPSTHGLKHNGASLPDSATTLAEIFSQAGYLTTAFVDGGYMRPNFGLNQGFEAYNVYNWAGLDVIGPDVINWLHQHADDNFMLLVHSYDVHADYLSPDPFRSLFTAGITPTPGFEPTVQQLETIRRSQWTDEPLQLNDADLAFAVARYDGGIRFADYWVGEIFDALQELGLDRTATIVLFSDHGEAFQEHGTVQHDRLYTPVARVPLLIRPPGGVFKEVIPSLVEVMDLMPTLVEGAGLAAPPDLQARSLLPLMRGETMRDRPVFSESPAFGNRRAVALGDYHLIGAVENDELELFEFRRDPLEQRDLAQEQPQVAARMRSLAKSWQDSLDRRGRPDAETPTLDVETLENLRALGYLD